MLDTSHHYADSGGPQGAVFFGRPGVFAENPVLADLTLPTGSWRLAALPRGGWPASRWPFSQECQR